MKNYPYIVIGGGIAGSTMAALLARAGRKVALFEKDAFPRDKLCGEFLSGESRRLLRGLGCLEAVLRQRPAQINRFRFTSSGGAVVEGAMPEPALGISRLALDRILFSHAEQCGADVEQRCEVKLPPDFANDKTSIRLMLRKTEANVTEAISGDWVIAAHGRRDALDRQLNREFMQRRHPYVGFKRHCRASRESVEGLKDRVEIHAVRDGYCGMCFIEDERINVCMLLKQEFVKRLPQADWAHIVEALGRDNELLRRRLDALEPCEDALHSVAQVPFTSKEPARGRMLFIGDSAGVISPLCGDGQAMAMQSAFLLHEILMRTTANRANDDAAAIKREWEATWRRAFQTRLRLGWGIQQLLYRPFYANAIMRMLQFMPPVTNLLARATRGR